jgi:hypothetical protein
MAGWDVETETTFSATGGLRGALLRRLRLKRRVAAEAEPSAEEEQSRAKALDQPCCVSPPRV